MAEYLVSLKTHLTANKMLALQNIFLYSYSFIYCIVFFYFVVNIFKLMHFAGDVFIDLNAIPGLVFFFY